MTRRGRSSPEILSRASSPSISMQKRGRLRARIYYYLLQQCFFASWAFSSFLKRCTLVPATHCSACAKHPSPMDEALLSFERAWFGANFLSSLDGPKCTSEEGTSRSTQPSRTASSTGSALNRTARKTTAPHPLSNWPWVYIGGRHGYCSCASCPNRQDKKNLGSKKSNVQYIRKPCSRQTVQGQCI